MSLTLAKSQADTETCLALLVFLQGAGDNSEDCEDLIKQWLEIQGLDPVLWQYKLSIYCSFFAVSYVLIQPYTISLWGELLTFLALSIICFPYSLFLSEGKHYSCHLEK